MSELSEIEMLKARLEMQQARIENLERENRHYLELLKGRDVKKIEENKNDGKSV